jgi:sugar phosphate permease
VKAPARPGTSPSIPTSAKGSILRAPWRAWTVLLIAWLGLLLCNTDRYAWSNVSVIAGPDFSLSPVFAISVFATAAQIGFLVSVAGGGLATDWIGARRILALAVTLLGAATVGFGMSSSIGIGVMLQFSLGLAAGPIYAAGVKLVSGWFGRTGRATAMGFFMTGTSLAVVVTNSAIPWLAERHGWRSAFYHLGVFTLVSGMLAFALLRDPATQGATPLRPASAIRFLAKSRNFRWLALVNMGGPWGTYGFAIWTTTLLVQRFHLSPSQAGMIVAAYGAGGLGAKLLIGMVSDAVGGRRKALAIACLLLCAAGLILFGNLTTPTALQVLAPFLGVAAFGWNPLVTTMIAETSRNSAGSAAGLSLLLTVAADSVQPALVALIYHATGSFALVFCLFAAGPILAAYAMSRVSEE